MNWRLASPLVIISATWGSQVCLLFIKWVGGSWFLFYENQSIMLCLQMNWWILFDLLKQVLPTLVGPSSNIRRDDRSLNFYKVQNLKELTVQRFFFMKSKWFFTRIWRMWFASKFFHEWSIVKIFRFGCSKVKRSR